MNENNLVQPAQQNLDALVQNGQISRETASLFGSPEEELNSALPSTPENQLETQTALEAETENDGISQEGLTAENSTQMSDRQLIEASQALSDKVQQQSDEGSAVSTEDIILADRQVQEQAQQVKDAMDIKDQTEQNKEVLKSEIAQEDAIQQVALQEQKESRAEMDAIQAEIQREQKELKNLSLNDMFDDEQAPISRLQATIAIVLGGLAQGFGGGNTPNAGLVAVNKVMDQHFEKKKLLSKERLNKKQRIFELLELDLERKQRSTDDELKKAKIEQIKGQMQQGRLQAQQQQVAQIQQDNLAKKLSSAKGMSREEVFSLDNKLQDKAVFFSDGKARFAANTETAKKIRQEILPNAKTALRGMDRLKELSNEFAGGSLSLEARAEAATLQQALKGALRLELFGPGVMTDREQALADKIIGNPTTLTSLSSLEKIKLETLSKKIVQGTKDRLRISGIEIPESKNELKIKQLILNSKKKPKKNKNGKKILSRQAAMSALMETGNWDEEESPF